MTEQAPTPTLYGPDLQAIAGMAAMTLKSRCLYAIDGGRRKLGPKTERPAGAILVSISGKDQTK